jgi:hypothetical protein
LYWQRIPIARLPYIAALIAAFIGHLLIKAAFIVVWSTFPLCGSPGKVSMHQRNDSMADLYPLPAALSVCRETKEEFRLFFQFSGLLWPQKVLPRRVLCSYKKKRARYDFFYHLPEIVYDIPEQLHVH